MTVTPASSQTPRSGAPARPGRPQAPRTAAGTSRTRKPSKRSELEDELATLIAWRKLPRPERQYRFLPDRRFTADFAFVAQLLIVEVEGGIYMPSGGGHRSVTGMERDLEKYALALLAGYRVLRVGPKDVKSGRALEWIEQALAQSDHDDSAAYWRRKALDAQAVLKDRDTYARSLEEQLR